MEYDVTDTAVFGVKPAYIYSALLAEFDGETNWWRPWLSFERRGKRPAGEVGAVHELRMTHRNRPIAFWLKTMEVRKNSLIRVRYIKGAYRGEGLWKIEQKGPKTTVSYRWFVRPVGLIARIYSWVFNAPKAQSELMSRGFRALARHIEEQDQGL